MLALLTAPLAQSAARTTAPNVYITVFVNLTAAKVHLSSNTAPEGSALRLLVTNTSSKPKRFSFDYQPLPSGKHTGFDLVFKAHQRREFLLALQVEARMKYFAGSSFDRAKGAQRGIFIVGPQCALCTP